MTGHNAQEKATRLVSGTHAAPSLERVGERDAGPSNSCYGTAGDTGQGPVGSRQTSGQRRHS